MTGPRIELNRSALTHNLTHAAHSLTSGGLMMAVKSNAYGHGADLVVPAALEAGVDEFAVLDIATALEIRSLAPETPLLAWLLFPGDQFLEAAQARIELGISSTWQLDEIAALPTAPPVTVHLKIDTGLNRNGATVAEWPDVVRRAGELEASGVIKVRAIWSHLSDTSVETSRQALTRLNDAVAVAKELGVEPKITHLAASHAAVELPETRLDLIRLGILAYGVSPFDDHNAQDLGFEPVLTLFAPLTSIDLSGNVSLGVGFSHGLIVPAQQATISIGGADYVLRDVQAESSTWAPVAEAGLVQAGEMVPLFGRGTTVSVEQWAIWCQTIGDEVLAKLDSSIQRTLVG